MDSFKGLFETVQIGDKIKSEDGCGPARVWTVTGKIADRWGRSLILSNDEDQTKDSCHGFSEIGIGFYYLGRGQTESTIQ